MARGAVELGSAVVIAPFDVGRVFAALAFEPDPASDGADPFAPARAAGFFAAEVFEPLAVRAAPDGGELAREPRAPALLVAGETAAFPARPRSELRGARAAGLAEVFEAVFLVMR